MDIDILITNSKRQDINKTNITVIIYKITTYFSIIDSIKGFREVYKACEYMTATLPIAVDD